MASISREPVEMTARPAALACLRPSMNVGRARAASAGQPSTSAMWRPVRRMVIGSSACKPWDVAAGTLIAREAGALVTDLHGNADYFKPPYCLLIANPALHGKMLEVLREQGV